MEIRSISENCGSFEGSFELLGRFLSGSYGDFLVSDKAIEGKSQIEKVLERVLAQQTVYYNEPVTPYKYELTDNGIVARIISKAAAGDLPVGAVQFNLGAKESQGYDEHRRECLRPYLDKTGWLAFVIHEIECSNLVDTNFIIACVDFSGKTIEREVSKHLFSLSYTITKESSVKKTASAELSKVIQEQQDELKRTFGERFEKFYAERSKEFEGWVRQADRQRLAGIKSIQNEIRGIRKDKTTASESHMRELLDNLEGKKRELDELNSDIMRRRAEAEKVVGAVLSGRINQKYLMLFQVYWELVEFST